MSREWPHLTVTYQYRLFKATVLKDYWAHALILSQCLWSCFTPLLPLPKKTISIEVLLYIQHKTDVLVLLLSISTHFQWKSQRVSFHQRQLKVEGEISIAYFSLNSLCDWRTNVTVTPKITPAANYPPPQVKIWRYPQRQSRIWGDMRLTGKPTNPAIVQARIVSYHPWKITS